MQNDCCNLCGSKNLIQREGKVRDNNNLKILECKNCGLVFLSSFDHINKDFYQNANMHNNEVDIDIEVWLQDTIEDDLRRFNMFKNDIKDKKIIDFGCGCGGFIKLAKGVCSKVYGVELEKRLQSYFKKEKLEVYSDISKISEKVDYIFLFHVLEHIEFPEKILATFKRHLKPEGKLIIEVPNSNDALLTFYKNKAFSEFTYWSPHLYLYNEDTISILLNKNNYKISKISQIQRYGLSNHLYWLSQGKPGGGDLWKIFNDKELNAKYSEILANNKICDTIIVECRI